ncbi:hypothetical protein MMC26_002874 [Xylographa opegraphella]|nr:hypothetical protein [Xylographa opegraphella]
MVNYGRKKKNLASVFSRFQSSHSLVETENNPQISNGRDTSVEDHAQGMQSINSNTNVADRAHPDADGEQSIDEVAEEPLDDTVIIAQESCTHHDALASEFSRNALGMNLSEVLDKPLPRIPKHQSLQAFLEGPESLCDDECTAPEMTNANETVVDDTENKTETESCPPVSHSISNSSGDTDTLSSSGTGEAECLGHEEVASYAIPVTAKAVHLGDKAASLIRHVDVKEPTPRTVQPPVKHKEARDLFKPRLGKSREVFARAKKAIAERFSGSTSSKEDLKWHTSSQDRCAPQSPTLAGTVNEKYRLNDNDANLGRLNRRLAEGANLSNPKIKALTGDGSVVRKSTPVANGLRSPMHWSDCLVDPFTDEQLLTHGTSSSGLVDSNTAERGRRVRLLRRRGTYEPLASSSQPNVPIENLSLDNTPKQPLPMPLITGLRQHRDLGVFCSRPVGFSTPRFRLEPEWDTTGRRRLSVVPASEPSLPDLNSDEPSEDEISDLPTLPNLIFNENEVSLKRTNTMVDQNVEPAPVFKRVKTDTMQRAANMVMLNRGTSEQLSVRYGNQRSGRNPISSDTDQGPRNSQGSNRTERSTSRGSVQPVKAVPDLRRSSIPISFKSTRSRQSRNSTPAPVAPVQDDALSDDELQME